MDEICVRTRPQRSNGRHNIIVMEKNSTVTIVTGQYYCCSVICLARKTVLSLLSLYSITVIRL